MMRGLKGIPIAIVGTALLAAPALAQGTKTRPVDVLAKPAEPQEPKNRVELNYEYENWDQGFADWHWVSLEYHRRFGWGTIIPRVNWAERFDQHATQYEVDAYPKLTAHTYLYLNYGVAEADTFFPERRYGAEIFWSVPKPWEFSAGLRRMEFGDKDVDILTGSVGYYHGNYYYSARPWISNKPGDTSVSLGLMMRRYYATRHDYWTVRVSGGQGSDSDQSIDQLITNNHFGGSFEWQKLYSKVWVVKAKAGYDWYEYETGTRRQGWLVGAGIARLF